MNRRILLCGLIVGSVTLAVTTCASAADGGVGSGDRQTTLIPLNPAATLQPMRHVIVTRFSVPRPQDPENADRHHNLAWLDRRIELFRRFFVPSVSRLEVPAVLLCSSKSAAYVDEKVSGWDWVEVAVQDEWYGGWIGDDDQTVTRMDSDDAIHERWLAAVEAAPVEAEVYCTREFLRYDISSGKLCAYARREPSPLVAFRSGRNPFALDHSGLDRHYRVHDIAGPYLLQVFHGGNVSSRPPSWYRRRLPLERLAAFGIGTQP